jgi:hypothetical protein
MFEVMDVLPSTKKGWLKPRRIPVKLKATKAMSCEYLTRTFQGHGTYTTQTFRADFAAGEVIFLVFSPRDRVVVGDMLGIEALSALGYLRDYFRMVATTG